MMEAYKNKTGINIPLIISDADNTDITRPILIFDTNILIDYCEKRDEEIKKYVKDYILPLYRKGQITIGTTFVNLAELLDKEFEISFQLMLIKKKYTPDTIIKITRSKNNTITCIKKFNDSFKLKLERRINKKMCELLSKLTVFYLSHLTHDDYAILKKLIMEGILSSQDALITLIIYKLGGYTYFLTKDNGLINSPIADNYIEIYNMHSEKQRKNLIERLREDIEFLEEF